MFKNFQVKKYLGYDQKSNTNRYRILIIDDDFSEEVEYGRLVVLDEAHLAAHLATALASAVIQVYSARQLNVPLNLFLLCRKIQERFSWYTIETQLKDYRKYVKEFAPYQEEVLQYHNRYNKQKVFW